MSTFAATAKPALRELPAPLAALLLQQANRYEIMFPHERRELESTLARLHPPRTAAMEAAVESFGALRLPPGMRLPDWEAEPAAYGEAFTAAMWSSGQIMAFRKAAQAVLPASEQDDGLGATRAIIVVYDATLKPISGSPDLFRRLRPAGTLYTRVSGEGDFSELANWLRLRQQAFPKEYAHWSISGGRSSATAAANLVTIGYSDMRPARLHLLEIMNRARFAGKGGGPEALRSSMLAMRGDDMGMQQGNDPVLRAFATDVLVGGSGTQLYSTTFVQWSVREALRRARPQSILAHFAPRNAAASMDVRLSDPEAEPPSDPAGSLVDAEMHTYMTYMNLLRLPAAREASMLVWHPGYNQALLIGASVAKGATDGNEQRLSDLLPRNTKAVKDMPAAQE